MSRERARDSANRRWNRTMTAHDVRHLTLCTQCRELGDRRDMVEAADRVLHPGCAQRALGLKGLLALPATEKGKIRLCDVSRATMRKLLDPA